MPESRILVKLEPYLIDLTTYIIEAEKDEVNDTRYKKHNYVMLEIACKIKNKPELSEFENYDIMKVLNETIRRIVKGLHELGVFIKKVEGGCNV